MRKPQLFKYFIVANFVILFFGISFPVSNSSLVFAAPDDYSYRPNQCGEAPDKNKLTEDDYKTRSKIYNTCQENITYNLENTIPPACKDIEQKIQDLADKCPGGGLQKCFENAQDCADGIMPQNSSNGSTSALSPLMGGFASMLMGGNANMSSPLMQGAFSSGFGAGNANYNNICRLKRTDWETMQQNQKDYVQMMQQKENDLQNNVTDIQGKISDQQQNQQQHLTDLSNAVKSYQNASQDSQDNATKTQLQFNADLRARVEEIQAMNNQLIHDQQTLVAAIKKRQNMATGYSDDCVSKFNADKQNAQAQIDTITAEMDTALQNEQEITKRESQKTIYTNKLNKAKANSEAQLTASYNTCMKANARQYQDDYQAASIAIQDLQGKIDLENTKIANKQKELKDSYDAFVAQMSSLQNRTTTELSTAQTQMASLQQVIQLDAQNIMLSTQRVQQLQQESQMQTMTTQALQSSLGASLGLNQGLNYSGLGMNTPPNQGAAFIGLGDATNYLPLYKTLVKASQQSGCKGTYGNIFNSGEDSGR